MALLAAFLSVKIGKYIKCVKMGESQYQINSLELLNIITKNIAQYKQGIQMDTLQNAILSFIL
jgi:hypothetical protein